MTTNAILTRLGRFSLVLSAILLVVGGCDGGDGGEDKLRINTTLGGLAVELTITYPGGSSETLNVDDGLELNTSFSAGEQYKFLAKTSASNVADSDLTTCTVSSSAESGGIAEILVWVEMPLGNKLLISCTSAGNWVQ